MENLDSKFAHYSTAPTPAYVPKNTEGIVSRWRSKDGFFAQAEALVAVCTLLFAIQVVFGWWRRCSSNLFIKYSLWLAYTITPTVATYTVGFTGSFISTGHTINELSDQDALALSLWSILLASVLLGSTNSIMAYDVDDNKQYMRHLVRQASYLLNMVAVVMMVKEVTGVSSSLVFFGIVVSINFIFCRQRFITLCAGMRASSFSDHGSLYLQDYMKNEHLKSTSYDPLTLQGYNYPIFQKGGAHFTVSQVWQENEGIWGSSGGARLKEVCLSFALCHLLRRRFFGAACPEATLPKTHDLVFRGLLSNAEENYEYAYRVIETELGLAYDRFFTNSESQFFDGAIMAVCGIGKLCLYFIFLSEENSAVNRNDRHIITAVIIAVLGAVELLQLYIYLSSDTLRVDMAFLCFIMPLRGSVSQLCRIQNNLPRLFGYWLNQIGQHSLLKDLHRRSITADVMGSLFWIVSSYDPPAFLRGISNPGVKGPDRIPLTPLVKKAIAQSLKSSEGRLSNGASSLEQNGQVQLSVEFLLGSHAGDMLMWHIATEYCDIAQSRQTVGQDDFALPNRDVATGLSSYCAYLMAFVPELLPDHKLETTAMFHRTRKAALQHLQKEKSLEQKYAKLSNYGQPPPQPNENMSDDQPPAQNGNINDDQPDSQGVEIFEKGVQLGKRLEGITDDGRRWKILADFWTEMILYIAPSDNARDHIQHLANGGELLTHLWALFTHAGILERDQPTVVNVQNAEANQTHQEQAQGLQPDQPHAEGTQNPVNLDEIEEEEIATERGGAHVHGNGGFPNLPAQGN